MKKSILKTTVMLSISITAFAQSETELREKLISNPNDAKINYDLGMLIGPKVVNRISDYSEKLGYITKAVKLDSTNSTYPYELAEVYRYSYINPDSAMYYYRESGRRFTKNKEKFSYNKNGWQSLLDVSHEVFSQEYFPEAYEKMKEFQAPNYYLTLDLNLVTDVIDKPNADAYIKLGDVQTKSIGFVEKKETFDYRFKKGLISYDKALKLDATKKSIISSRMSEILKGTATKNFEDKNYVDALNYFELALKYVQNDPEIYSGIGYIKLEKLDVPDYKGAIANFQKALTLSTSSMDKKDHLENIGLCYEKQKDYKNAIIFYEKGVALEPNFAKSLHFKLARVYEALGNQPKVLYHKRLS